MIHLINPTTQAAPVRLIARSDSPNPAEVCNNLVAPTNTPKSSKNPSHAKNANKSLNNNINYYPRCLRQQLQL